MCPIWINCKRQTKEDYANSQPDCGLQRSILNQDNIFSFIYQLFALFLLRKRIRDKKDKSGGGGQKRYRGGYNFCVLLFRFHSLGGWHCKWSSSLSHWGSAWEPCLTVEDGEDDKQKKANEIIHKFCWFARQAQNTSNKAPFVNIVNILVGQCTRF